MTESKPFSMSRRLRNETKTEVEKCEKCGISRTVNESHVTEG